MKPKVAQILYSGLGGHGDVAFGIVESDVARQFQHVMGFVGIEPMLHAYRVRALAAGASVFALRAVRGKPWRNWAPLGRWLQRERPDLVLLHSPPSLLPCLIYSRLHRRRLVVVEHQTNSLKTGVERVVSRLALRSVDRVVVLTEEYRDDLAALVGRRSRLEKVCVIANGVDTTWPQSEPARLAAGRVVRLGMAARFSASKRFDVLIDMAEELKAMAPHVTWHLSLAGDGTELARTRRLAQRSSAADSIEFAGVVAGDALARWYRELDVYVHASEGESLSISILQAMAAALPIVASRRPGIESLLDSGRGLLVDQEGSAFARAVCSLVADATSAKEMGQCARRASVELYSRTVMFERYRILFRELGVG